MSNPERLWTSTRAPRAGLRELLRSEEIDERARELAAQIARDYGDSPPLMIAVLKGAFVFLSDLIRHIDAPVEIDFIRLASYGSGTIPGELQVISDITTSVSGRDVLIVEDIVDTGRSLDLLVRLLRDRGAKSVRICALLDKPYRRAVDIPLDYVGFSIPDVFVVGYGIDLGERHRELPDIYAVTDEEEAREQ